MKEIRFELVPCKNSKVVWADDVVFELHEKYFSVSIDVVEEVPKDAEDVLMGSKERKRDSMAYCIKSSIYAIEWGYDNDNGLYDFTIFTAGTSWAYNCKDKASAKEYVGVLTT